jgi:hypothetical protein
LFFIDSKQPHASEVSRDVLEKLYQSSKLAPHPADHAKLPTIERIERALILLAYFMELDGDVHVPMYEKFETELAELKKMESTKARARQRLLSCMAHGGCSVPHGWVAQAKHTKQFFMSALSSARRWYVIAFLSSGWVKFARAPSPNVR